jgi:hypothetical protein
MDRAAADVDASHAQAEITLHQRFAELQQLLQHRLEELLTLAAEARDRKSTPMSPDMSRLD